MIIRHEKISRIETISKITVAAFKNHPYSNNTEQFIIKALRRANVRTLLLVPEVKGQITEQIAFSPVTISDVTTDWHGFGHSVVPEFQK
jgi:putative acetyltransferase